MNEMLDVHVLNNLIEIVHIQLTFDDLNLEDSLLRREEEMLSELSTRLLPRGDCETLNCACWSNFKVLNVLQSPLANFLAYICIIGSLRLRYDRLSSR